MFYPRDSTLILEGLFRSVGIPSLSQLGLLPWLLRRGWKSFALRIATESLHLRSGLLSLKALFWKSFPLREIALESESVLFGRISGKVCFVEIRSRASCRSTIKWIRAPRRPLSIILMSNTDAEYIHIIHSLFKAKLQHDAATAQRCL